MIKFLKLWYKEFKNEQAIKAPLQSTMMTKEEVLDACSINNSSVFQLDSEIEEDEHCFRDVAGNPDINGDNYW